MLSYGITSVADRVDGLLIQTMISLAGAGFSKPVLFIDGTLTAPPWLAGYNVVMKHPPMGVLGSWFNALTGLFAYHPGASYYALFEDDLIANQQLRQYLDECLPELPEKTYLCLYTSSQNALQAGGEEGWHHNHMRGDSAVGFVFPRQVAIDLARSGLYIERMQHGNYWRGSTIYLSLSMLGYKQLIHYPSLLQHIGTLSTMGNEFGQTSAWREVYEPPKSFILNGEQ